MNVYKKKIRKRLKFDYVILIFFNEIHFKQILIALQLFKINSICLCNSRFLFINKKEQIQDNYNIIYYKDTWEGRPCPQDLANSRTSFLIYLLEGLRFT